MSQWIDTKKEDIEIEKGVVQIWFESDDFGNRYINFPIELLFEVIKEQLK